MYYDALILDSHLGLKLVNVLRLKVNFMFVFDKFSFLKEVFLSEKNLKSICF